MHIKAIAVKQRCVVEHVRILCIYSPLPQSSLHRPIPNVVVAMIPTTVRKCYTIFNDLIGLWSDCFSPGRAYGLGIKLDKKENEKRCRNGVPQSTRTRISDGKYTKPHPSLHLSTKEKRCRNWALYIYHHLP